MDNGKKVKTGVNNEKKRQNNRKRRGKEQISIIKDETTKEDAEDKE